jgi:ABC-type antimicrobial peptide transport system permease subunit
VFLPRLSTTLLNAFVVCALLLAALGIYGVLPYTVTQRTCEVGLRTALGAETGRTIGLVVGNSMLLISVGVATGLVAATLLARSMAGVLFGISPFDPVSFTVAAVVLIGVGLAASLIPARRAALVDPMVALRNQ